MSSSSELTSCCCRGFVCLSFLLAVLCSKLLTVFFPYLFLLPVSLSKRTFSHHLQFTDLASKLSVSSPLLPPSLLLIQRASRLLNPRVRIVSLLCFLLLFSFLFFFDSFALLARAVAFMLLYRSFALLKPFFIVFLCTSPALSPSTPFVLLLLLSPSLLYLLFYRTPTFCHTLNAS